MNVFVIYAEHNATVGFFSNGKCREIIHEEKFTNIKNYHGFPMKSIEYIRKKYKIRTFDKCICVLRKKSIPEVQKKVSLIERVYPTSFSNFFSTVDYYFPILFKVFYNPIRIVLNFIFDTIKKEKLKNWLIKKKLISSKDDLIFLDHHLCHGMTPLYFYLIKERTLVLTLDGQGDYYCGKIFVYENNKIKEILKMDDRASLGGLYARITSFLGMKPVEHEYKVMGLSAYVTDENYYKEILEKLKKIIKFNKEELQFWFKYRFDYGLLTFFKKQLIGYRFDNIAAAVQKLLEEYVTEWIREAIKKTGIRTIAVSGGAFMNVKLNQKILFMPEVKKVYFQPSCGDDSLSIGGSAKVFMDNNIKLNPIKTMYLGLEYTNKEVEEFLGENNYFEKYQIKYYDDIEKMVAEMLAEFKIVARLKGAGEWGARSLCNRAILGNASDLKTFYQVNDMIKMRDFWMPFAPTILEEWAPEYIKNWNIIKEKAYESSKYMIITFDSTKLAQEHLIAAIHQKNKTLRPQILAEEDNYDMYKLLKYYEKLTGMGGLLNTSLNLHGYPLVGTLEQSMFTFENSGLMYMALENFLICKK